MTELLAIGTSQPTAPVDPDRPDDDLIGPGIGGFVAIFVLAVAVVLLIRDMNRRIQRVRYRGDSAASGPAAPASSDSDDGAPDPKG
jgi:hypothetical protein